MSIEHGPSDSSIMYAGDTRIDSVFDGRFRRQRGADHSAHGVMVAGTDELSGAFKVHLDGYGDVSPERVAKILYLDAGWQGGTLRVAACNTGNFSPHTLNGIFGDLLAKELAILGVPPAVIAPTGPVTAMVPGSGSACHAFGQLQALIHYIYSPVVAGNTLCISPRNHLTTSLMAYPR